MLMAGKSVRHKQPTPQTSPCRSSHLIYDAKYFLNVTQSPFSVENIFLKKNIYIYLRKMLSIYSSEH